MPSTLLLHDRRILFVVPQARFDEAQFYQSWQLLSEEGAWLVAASDAPTGVASGESGAVARTLRLAQVKPANYDAIILLEGKEDAAETVASAVGVITAALGAGRTVAAFGKVGGELHAAGLPVVRAGKSLSRFLAELSVKVSRQPRIPAPEVAAPDRHR